MERFQSNQSRELFSEVARFISYAMRFAPEELVRLANDRRKSSSLSTPKSTSDTIGQLIYEKIDPEEELDSSAGQLFFDEALEDVGRVMEVIAETHPDLESETILEVMSDPGTIDAIALLALRPAENMRPYINTNLKDTGNLSPDNSYTINDQDLRIDTIGCPAAGYRATDDHEGQVKPMYIFKKFIPWAARVHLLSDEWQSFRGNLEK